MEALAEKVDLILDGGLCEVGLESTIVDMTGHTPVILRKGMVTADEISAVLEMPIAVSPQETVRVPGMHHVHYAPSTRTLLMNTSEIINFLKTLKDDELPIILLIHTELSLPAVNKTFCVNMPNQAKAYAHELYRVLRSLDQERPKYIIIEDVPNTIEWQAIRDRLQKASGRTNDSH
jgi:L-threonylcarbamoyladenylate synthase